MRIGCLTIHDDHYQRLADITNPAKRAYCDRHGYTPIFLKSPDRFDYFSFVSEAMNCLPRFDWLWVSGIDGHVTNPAVRLETFLDDEHDFITTCDFNGLNNGSMFMRNTGWMMEFLGKWLVSKHRLGGWTCPEQTALAYLLYLEPKDKWHILRPQRRCNAYMYRELKAEYPEGEWEPGDFFLHLAGIPLERRIEILNGLAPEKISRETHPAFPRPQDRRGHRDPAARQVGRVLAHLAERADGPSVAGPTLCERDQTDRT